MLATREMCGRNEPKRTGLDSRINTILRFNAVDGSIVRCEVKRADHPMLCNGAPGPIFATLADVRDACLRNKPLIVEKVQVVGSKGRLWRASAALQRKPGLEGGRLEQPLSSSRRCGPRVSPQPLGGPCPAPPVAPESNDG